MGKALRMAAGALGAGALLLSAAGTASAGSGGGGFSHQDARCPASFSFSLLLPPTDSCNILLDNHKTLLKQTAGGNISGDADVSSRGSRR